MIHIASFFCFSQKNANHIWQLFLKKIIGTSHKKFPKH